MSRRNAVRSKQHQWNETDLETVRLVGQMLQTYPEMVKVLKVKMEHSLDLNRFKLHRQGVRPRG